jgi:hypothetical protein
MSIKRNSFLSGGLLLSVLILVSFTRINTFAASIGSTLTTAPVSVNLVATPGLTVSTKLQVQNNSLEPLMINVHLEEFKASGTGGQAQIYVPPANDPSLSWVHFSQTSFVAEPGVWNDVTMSISVPSGAQLGYYYAVLLTPNVSNSTVVNSNSLKGSNAILVLLDTNSKNEHKLLKTSSFSSSKGLYQFLPASLNISVKNPGNIQLIPQGDVYISRTPNGKSIATLPFNTGEGNVLPGSSRVFSVQWTNGFPSYVVKTIDGQQINGKNGKPEQQLQWNFSSSLSEFRFGKYYAHLVLVYNNGSQDFAQDSYTSFWVIPWTLILIVIFGIVAIIVIWKLINKYIRVLWRKLRGRNAK